jgi:hypothetical protein
LPESREFCRFASVPRFLLQYDLLMGLFLRLSRIDT